MAEIKWIKLSVGIFDNRKIKQIRTLPEGDSLVVIWLQLLCLAGSINDLGKIYLTESMPYTEQMLATAFGETLTTIQLALTTFKAFGMVEVIDDVIYINNWEKYQAIEGMEKVREQNRNRFKKWYDKQKQLPNDTSNVRLTLSNAIDIDKDKEIDCKMNKENNNKNNHPAPTIEEVSDYINKKGYLSINVEQLYKYCELNSWKTSKGKTIDDWKGYVDNWYLNQHPYIKGGI